MHRCTVLLKDKIVINDAVIAFNIYWDSKRSHQYCSLTFIPMLDKNNSATDTVIDLVNTKHDGNILQDAILPSYVLSGAHSRSFWQWRVVQLWSCDILMFFVCLSKKHAAVKWKQAVFFGFPVSPGSAETLIRWGGTIKYLWLPTFSLTLVPKTI